MYTLCVPLFPTNDCEVEGHIQSGWKCLVDTLMHVMCLSCGPVGVRLCSCFYLHRQIKIDCTFFFFLLVFPHKIFCEPTAERIYVSKNRETTVIIKHFSLCYNCTFVCPIIYFSPTSCENRWTYVSCQHYILQTGLICVLCSFKKHLSVKKV